MATWRALRRQGLRRWEPSSPREEAGSLPGLGPVGISRRPWCRACSPGTAAPKSTCRNENRTGPLPGGPGQTRNGEAKAWNHSLVWDRFHRRLKEGEEKRRPHRHCLGRAGKLGAAACCGSGSGELVWAQGETAGGEGPCVEHSVRAGAGGCGRNLVLMPGGI